MSHARRAVPQAPQSCTLVIQDEVNVKFDGVDPFLRRKIVNALKLFVPHARHTPAFKLGRWDGKISFATAGGGTYLNLLDKVLPMVTGEGYDVEIEDRRLVVAYDFPHVTEDYPSDRAWPLGHERAGQAITLRDYQCELINNLLANPQSIHQASTGAGKTIVTACLSHIVEPYGRSVVIVPNKSLVAQTEQDYLAMGLDVGVFFGDRKEWDRTHTICTWQSLTALAKRTRNDEAEEGATIDAFASGVGCVIVDEVHTVKGQELRELLCGPFAHVPIRWGLTGTVPKEDWDFWNLLCAIGPVVGQVRAADLQAKGVLADCDIEVVMMDDSDVEFKTYHEEYDYLVTDKLRLLWIARYCQALADEGNTLLLVDRIETGEALAALIPDAFFIHGGVKVKKRAEQFGSVAREDSKMLIATYGTAAVGINAPRLFTIVLLEPGKSFVRVIQSIGRGLRKAHDKQRVKIVDLGSSAKFSARHRVKRLAFYREAEYPFTTRKAQWRLA